MAQPSHDVPSLTVVTLRRSFYVGRIYVISGAAFPALFAILLLSVPSGAQLLSLIFPLELPVFAVIGSMGALLIFTADRTKGVLEYMIAYGIRPVRLFSNGLISALGLGGLVLGVAIGVALAALRATGGSIPVGLVELLVLYTIPMGLAAVAFATMVGMIWSSMSTPRTGINSPIGLAPMIGLAPVLVVLVVVPAASPSQGLVLAGSSAAVLTAAVLGLLAVSGRLRGGERFRSPL